MKIAEGLLEPDSEENRKITIVPAEEKKEVDFEVTDFNSQPVELTDESELTGKVISYIEKEVRSSFEYRQYTNYLKNELDLTKCALLPELDIKNLNFSLEFHHAPLNLYEIVEIVGKSMLDKLKENETLSCFDISEKVVLEHYRNHVGLIPLDKTCHDLVHNRALIVPLNKVNGNYDLFLAEYSDYISDDIKERIRDAKLESISEESAEYNDEKLKKSITNYNINYLDHNEENDETSEESENN